MPLPFAPGLGTAGMLTLTVIKVNAVFILSKIRISDGQSRGRRSIMSKGSCDSFTRPGVAAFPLAKRPSLG